MNENLQNQLSTILQFLIESATATKDFIVAETPEVIQQLLIWKAFYHGIIILVPFVLLVISCKLCIKCWKLDETCPYNEISAALQVLSTIVTAILCVVSVLAFLHNLELIQILVAPKVYLIEYANNLIGACK